MRRFGRVLVNVAMVLSSAICVTMVVLWARSFRTSTAMGWVWPDAAAIGLIFNRGEFLPTVAGAVRGASGDAGAVLLAHATWRARRTLSCLRL
jgi:hypothetical protein